MKATAIALLTFAITGVIAGDKPSTHCQKVDYEPGRCKAWYPRDFELDGRDIELDDRDIELDERDVEDLGERDEGLGERGYPPNVCKKKCPKHNLKCTKYSWAKGYPKYKGGFSASVDCRKGNDYTVSGKIGSCKGGYGDCLVVTYDGGYWPQGHEVSYVGLYQNKWYGPKKVADLNYSSYCTGNVCSIPIEKLPGYPGLCDKDFWVGYDGGRCKPSYPSHGYNDKKKPAPPSDVVNYAKLHIECYGKKECKSYCCDI